MKKNAREGIKLIKRDIHPEGCTKTIDGWNERAWVRKQTDR
jgi:hypothetical protein